MSIGKIQKSKIKSQNCKLRLRQGFCGQAKFKSEKDKKPKISNKLIVILGPTGSGKTEWSIRLAKKCQAEIVLADSRQGYKEMIIGTAKPICQYGIPHHLIDVVYPNQEFNVAIYKKLAIKAIKDIQKRGKIPFLVGGTGLYIQAIVDNIDFPKVKPVEKLRKILGQKTEKQLFEIYKKLDPEGAKFIEKQNKRRLIRAIEVCKSTNKPFFQQRKKGKPIFNVLQIGIKIPKQELGKRIEKRVEKMFKLGLEQEARSLFKRYGFGISSMQTIGYQEWIPYLNKDRLIRVCPRQSSQNQASAQIITKAEREKIKQEIILHTMQFAKRQMTWFKRDARIHWLKDLNQAKKLIMDFLNTPKKN